MAERRDPERRTGRARAVRRFAGAAAGLALLALAPAPAAEACSCAQTLSVTHPCETFHESAVVFLGRAVAEPTVRGGEWPDRVYTFEVEEPFAGVTGATVEVVTGMGDGDCGVDFEVGRLTFVDAWHNRAGTEIVVGLCGTTSTRDLDSPNVAYAHARAAGDPGIAIFGRVMRGPARPVYRGPSRDGLAGVAVSVHGPDGESLEATTDAEGVFEIPGPLAGSYTVRATLPGEGGAVVEETIEVPPDRCQGVDLVVD
jgi:hypothetical protein